jgi:2-keto-3-deoxy-galactonokinase
MARATDVGRDRAVATLARAYADGRLSLRELETRSERVLAARSTWELGLQLRGLLIGEAHRTVRRGARIAGAVVVWGVLSMFLLAAFVGSLFASHASAWTLVFPVLWVVATVLTVRDVRRA